MILTLYSRVYCSLCHTMLAELKPWQERYGFQLKVLDVDDDPVLEARFNELVPDTGQKIERVRAEAELRFAVALPLIFLVGLFAIEESPLWVLGWLVPIALFKAGFALRRQGDRELIEALRARNSEELQRITPVFADFNTAAQDLAAGLRKADWEGANPSELDPSAVPDYLAL